MLREIVALEIDTELTLRGVTMEMTQTGEPNSASVRHRLAWHGDLSYSLPTSLLGEKISKLKAHIHPCKLFFGDESICEVYLEEAQTRIDQDKTIFDASFKVKGWVRIESEMSKILK